MKENLSSEGREGTQVLQWLEDLKVGERGSLCIIEQSNAACMAEEMPVEGGDLSLEEMWPGKGEQVSQAPVKSFARGDTPGFCWFLTQLNPIHVGCSPRAEPCPGRRLCSSDYKLTNTVDNGRDDGMRGREENIAEKLL